MAKTDVTVRVGVPLEREIARLRGLLSAEVSCRLAAEKECEELEARRKSLMSMFEEEAYHRAEADSRTEELKAKCAGLQGQLDSLRRAFQEYLLEALEIQRSLWREFRKEING